MGQKFHKLNSKYGIIDYPILLKDLESIIQEFPKSERKFYEYAIKALKKDVKKKEKILHMTSADPKLTKFGFMVITEKKLLFVTMKGGIFGGADTEVVEFKSIKEVDFDIAPNPLGMATMQLGILHLKIKGKLGMSSKRTIRNIDEHSLDKIVAILREQTK
ncbi:PH domain-containing protein [Bacillus subtilis]|uniref:PH domain-containing protein n=1 Tax=Bacillus subtilis TaxID=1423 RepID=UPI002DB742D8|nr:PH domain-containing protein [Bacillus subtilis]MEC1539790.1 PH domain-containing protein [Bacillus subtilis]